MPRIWGSGSIPGKPRLRAKPARRWPKPSRACRSKGVDAVNLSDLLRDKTVDVFVETAHFNATGHEMIAAAIAREILHPAAP